MGYDETKMINSDFLNEPLNYLMYIDSIEKYGDNSYMFDQDDISKKKFRELISKSAILYTHKNIHACLIRNLKSDDLYYFFKNHKNLGECLNLLHGGDYFSKGNFNTVCEYMNMEAIRIMNDEFLYAFGMIIEEILKSDKAFEWINARFGVDLSSFDSLSTAILDEEGWKLMLSSGPLMACCSTSQWFNKEVVQAQYKTIWVSSSGDYYDDDGIHYTASGEADGANISTDALKVMKDNKLVQQSYLTLMDSAYKRLKEALYWFAQHESVNSLKNYRELLQIFVGDENCCQYLADYPDILTDCLEDREFANQIFGSELAFNKIASSHDATEALVNFIANIQTSYDCLQTIKTNLALIPQNSDKIYNSDPLKDEVNDTLDVVNQTMADINACQTYNNTTMDLINSYTSDEKFASRLFSNSNFVTWCTENSTFVKNFVSNKTMITALCTNATTMPIACKSSVFCNAMAASSVAMNAVAASSVAMNAVAASSVAMNAVAASSVAMNAVAASSVAMNAVVNSPVAREALYNNASVTEPILQTSPVALNAMRSNAVQVQCQFNGHYNTLYDGRAFVFEVWQSYGRSGGYSLSHGNYIIGDQIQKITFNDCDSTNRHPVNKFASTVVVNSDNPNNAWANAELIFKI